MLKCLEPIYDKKTKILILGSFPSKISLSKQEYYANPMNQFWRIISHVYENKIIEFNDYKEKILFIKKYNIALWDVVKEANRKGSLDINIRNPKYNNIYDFIKINKIEKVYVNGTKAESLLKKYLKENNLTINYTLLPSSSSANTKYTLKEKVKIWTKIIK